MTDRAPTETDIRVTLLSAARFVLLGWTRGHTAVLRDGTPTSNFEARGVAQLCAGGALCRAAFQKSRLYQTPADLYALSRAVLRVVGEEIIRRELCDETTAALLDTDPGAVVEFYNDNVAEDGLDVMRLFDDIVRDQQAVERAARRPPDPLPDGVREQAQGFWDEQGADGDQLRDGMDWEVSGEGVMEEWHGVVGFNGVKGRKWKVSVSISFGSRK